MIMNYLALVRNNERNLNKKVHRKESWVLGTDLFLGINLEKSLEKIMVDWILKSSVLHLEKIKLEIIIALKVKFFLLFYNF